MNSETKKILNLIKSNEQYVVRLINLREKYNNSKEFYNQMGYFIMDIVNTEKTLMNLKRKNIEFDIINKEFFI